MPSRSGARSLARGSRQRREGGSEHGLGRRDADEEVLSQCLGEGRHKSVAGQVSRKDGLGLGVGWVSGLFLHNTGT